MPQVLVKSSSFVSSINNNGRDIIIVVLNCPDRWNVTEKIYKHILERVAFQRENYKELVRITTEKTIPIVVVKRGDIIKIENTVKFQVLFPSDKLIAENVLNNNSFDLYSQWII